MNTANESKITAAGQTTIPVEIRRALGLGAGDRLRYFIEDNHFVVMPVKGSIKDLKGFLPPPPRPITLEEMDEAIAQGIVESFHESIE